MIENSFSVPFCLPDIGQDEIDAAARVLRCGWLTTGPEVEQFEAEFRAYVGAPHALAVNSCTSGLHLALSALGIGSGDEVITTPLTFCGTIQAIEETGARPVLCDVGPDLNLDTSQLEHVLTPRTRAIVPVHLAGLACRLDEIWEFARQRRLFVVEDAAHAVGSEYHGIRVGGGRSDATVFSFYATKNLTTGEGGMITSTRHQLADRMRLMCSHGIRRAEKLDGQLPSWYYEVSDRGFKYNLSDIQAAIGRCQLRKLESGLCSRARIARLYRDRLASFEEIELPGEPSTVRHAWHLFVIRLNLDRLRINRNEFTAELARRGIGSSVHFIPLPLHPYYRRRFGRESTFSEALRQFPRLLSLPIYPGLTVEKADLVIAAVRDVLAHFRRPVYAAAHRG
jgi:dTDP-4-amino-4,6-dideoxygalactose transaminase